MGNYASCYLATPLLKNARVTRVIFPTGEVKQYKKLLKAAELMLDCPGCFIVNSSSLHIGRRFFALGADDELDFGNVYILFPMTRLNSTVTGADMAVNSTNKRISGAKVFVMLKKPKNLPVEEFKPEKLQRWCRYHRMRRRSSR